MGRIGFSRGLRSGDESEATTVAVTGVSGSHLVYAAAQVLDDVRPDPWSRRDVMTTARRSLVPSLVLAAALLGACGDDDDGDAASDTDAGATVTIEQSRFEPDPVEVAVGSEVTFENLDPYAHTVTSAEGSDVEFDSGELGQDDTFTQVFEEAGTYAYVCEIHPTMRAEVVVS